MDSSLDSELSMKTVRDFAYPENDIRHYGVTVSQFLDSKELFEHLEDNYGGSLEQDENPHIASEGKGWLSKVTLDVNDILIPKLCSYLSECLVDNISYLKGTKVLHNFDASIAKEVECYEGELVYILRLTSNKKNSVIEEEKPEVDEEEKPEVGKEEQPEVGKEEQPEVGKEEQPEVGKEEQPEVGKEEQPEVDKRDNPEVDKRDNPEVDKRVNPEVDKEGQPEDPEVYKTDKDPITAERDLNTKPKNDGSGYNKIKNPISDNSRYGDCVDNNIKANDTLIQTESKTLIKRFNAKFYPGPEIISRVFKDLLGSLSCFGKSWELVFKINIFREPETSGDKSSTRKDLRDDVNTPKDGKNTSQDIKIVVVITDAGLIPKEYLAQDPR